MNSFRHLRTTTVRETSLFLKVLLLFVVLTMPVAAFADDAYIIYNRNTEQQDLVGQTVIVAGQDTEVSIVHQADDPPELTGILTTDIPSTIAVVASIVSAVITLAQVSRTLEKEPKDGKPNE